MNTPQFTAEQIRQWQRYEQVRESGACNMWSPQVCTLAGLTREQHLFCLENYSALRAQHEREEDARILAMAKDREALEVC